MGKGKLKDGGGSLTEEDFEHMAQEWEMTKAEAKKHVSEELKKQLGS